MSYHVNEKGFYGKFGGAYVPEMLYPNVEELRQNYLRIIQETDFQEELQHLLKDYVGAANAVILCPTPFGEV